MFSWGTFISKLHQRYIIAMFHLPQEEVAKEGKEEKERENLGKLEFTLDYNFTDNQVSLYLNLHLCWPECADVIFWCKS